MSFPIDVNRRPYNNLVLPCECVIAFFLDTLDMYGGPLVPL